MYVAEIFRSLQGECNMQGAPTIFVRFAGCNLACVDCDTAYSRDQQGAAVLSASAVLDRVRQLDNHPRFVCLTGGEPLIQPAAELQDLIARLAQITGLQKIIIETNGSLLIRSFLEGLQKERLSFAVDYKLPGSQMSQSMVRQNFPILRSCDTLKFLCHDTEDMQAALDVLRRLTNCHECSPIVYFHFTGGTPSPVTAEFVLAHCSQFAQRFDIRYGIQLHKLLWGGERGR